MPTMANINTPLAMMIAYGVPIPRTNRPVFGTDGSTGVEPPGSTILRVILLTNSYSFVLLLAAMQKLAIIA